MTKDRSSHKRLKERKADDQRLTRCRFPGLASLCSPVHQVQRPSWRQVRQSDPLLVEMWMDLLGDPLAGHSINQSINRFYKPHGPNASDWVRLSERDIEASSGKRRQVTSRSHLRFPSPESRSLLKLLSHSSPPQYRTFSRELLLDQESKILPVLADAKIKQELST